MKAFSNFVNTFSRKLQFIETVVGSIFLTIMLVLMLVNAMARYIFDFSIIWSDEVNNYLFVWIGFLSSAYIMCEDRHMRVTAIFDRLPPTAKYIVKVVTDIIMIIVLAAFIPGFFKLMKIVSFSGLLRIPLKYVYAILPISFAMMCIHTLNNILQQSIAYFQSRK